MNNVIEYLVKVVCDAAGKALGRVGNRFHPAPPSSNRT